MTPMNCFVIMPFDHDFDDVHAAIKVGVEAALASHGGKCFRLDESRPAGRITGRLLNELSSASLCIADLTGNRPNVMWETGYAMALGKPTIVITQELEQLPFDLKDMQTIRYDRRRLTHSLSTPLHSIVLDTVRVHIGEKPTSRASEQEGLIGTLLAEVQELKAMVASSVAYWTPELPARGFSGHRKPDALEGAWISEASDTHLYAQMIDDQLIVPYCFAGNDRLTGAYVAWQRLGDYWFARFAWIDGSFCGFTFLRHESIDVVSGAYWHNDEVATVPDSPPKKQGVFSRWVRSKSVATPRWASEFFDEVRAHGLPSCLTAVSKVSVKSK